MPIRAPIPWARADYWGDEERYVVSALRSSWISGGAYVERLEAECARFLDVPYAFAVSNGTAALNLAYLALGIGPGDEIIVPGFGFLAAANVAMQLGVVPVFCDVDPDTWCIKASDCAPLITPRTRAIVAIHSYGNMCDVNELVALGVCRGVPIIEDAAEAFGSIFAQRAAGSCGLVNTFSFHATKTITTGEGGLVTTCDADLANRIRLYRSHGLRRERHYWHEIPGNNFRLTNLQAALGVAQMEHLSEIIAARARIYAQYRQRLSRIPGVKLQRITEGCEPVVWAVAAEIDPSCFPQGRDALMQQLATKGIETRPGFQPPSEMDYFAPTDLPVSEKLGRCVISVPSYAGLSADEVDFVCTELANLCMAP